MKKTYKLNRTYEWLLLNIAFSFHFHHFPRTFQLRTTTTPSPPRPSLPLAEVSGKSVKP